MHYPGDSTRLGFAGSLSGQILLPASRDGEARLLAANVFVAAPSSLGWRRVPGRDRRPTVGAGGIAGIAWRERMRAGGRRA